MAITNHLASGSLLQGATYRYTIERVLGQGTFGITYLASTVVQVEGALGTFESEIRVAVKEFFMRDLNERKGSQVSGGSQGGIYEHYRRKFAREAQNLSKLHHPNIVRVLESFEANNTVYYAMEFCEGGSLDELIAAQGGLSEAVALDYARQIGSALDYMHSEKVLHLDLKPGNVMLRKNGSVALIDFGLSKQYDEEGAPESSTTIGGGTPGYAPIEQANYREGGQFAAAIDVYALGATLFKMLTGERPAEASVLLNEGFPAEKLTAKGVSERTIAVVAKAMEGLKRNRYATVAEFLKALDGTAATPPVAPTPEEKTVYNDPAAEATVLDETKHSDCTEVDEPPTTHPNLTQPTKPTAKSPKNWGWMILIMLMMASCFWVYRNAKISKEQAEQQRIVREAFVKDSLEKAEKERIAQMVDAGKGRDGVFQVGDYYNVNGKEGVVFEVDASGRHGKIINMAVPKISRQWTSNDNENVRWIKASSKTDGLANMKAVQQRPNWYKKYPAFAWCADLGEGWYLPAIEELKLFTLNKHVHDIVNQTIAKKGGVLLYNVDKSGWHWYWSSTEGTRRQSLYQDGRSPETGSCCVYIVNMFYGKTEDTPKSGYGGTRAIAKF